MEPADYYKILQARIESFETLDDNKRQELQKNLDTLFMVIILKFLQLNIPPYLFTKFFEDLKEISSESVPVSKRDIRMERFVQKYVQEIPDYSSLFETFVQEQFENLESINLLLKEVKE